MRIFTVLWITALLSSLSWAQEVKFEVNYNADKITANSTINIEFTLRNVEGHSFTPPDFDGMTIVGGPSTSTSMTFINGRSSQTKSWSYTLLATKEGRYRFGSATVIVGNDELKTDPFIIEVLPAEAAASIKAEEEDAFVRLELSDSTVIIGQQVLLDFVLYTRVQIENVKFLTEPNYDGFFSVPLNMRRQRGINKMISGKEYYVQSVKRVSLFPQQTGTYVFDPIVASLAIADGTTSRRSIFSFRNTRSVNRQTNPVTIKVSSSPAGAPLSYSGGVGNYRMTAVVDKRSITTDDAIKINMTIQGSGDPKIVQAPDQDFGAHLEIYEPNIVREDQYIDKGYVTVDKEFEYLVVPKKTGRFSMLPKFSYYNPDSNRYETLTAGPFTVNVVQGTKAINTMESVQTVAEIAPLIASPQYVAPSTMEYGSSWHLVVLGLILLIIPAMLLYKLKLRQNANIDPKLLQQQNAERIAIEKLSKAKGLLPQGDARSFYEEIQAALFGYLSDRIEVPYSKMNRQDIAQILHSHDVSTDQVHKIEQLLDQVEVALYAGVHPDKMSASYEDAKQVILDVEAHFRSKD